MAGLTSSLNIAKNALLNFQMVTSVISHNIANVNNPAFSRQKAIETTYPPSPSPVGAFGSGSKIEKIIRLFDAFIERNINLKKTDYGLFSASESALNILESLFNETQDSGLSKILREFWQAWQNLAIYPENLSARTQVVETGKLIVEAFKAKFQGMKDLESHIGLKLKEVVNNINRLAGQIAELNLQIIARESGGKTANDLRDQRDRLVGELSQLASIQYFETKEGAYNIILGRGFNLVSLGYHWKLEISGLDVYWVGTRGEKVPLTSREVASGELGGWLKILEQLSDSYNYEYVSSTKAIYKQSGVPIGEYDTFGDLGVSGEIKFVGKDHFGKEISGTFDITQDKPIRAFLDEIERAFDFTVRAYIKDGRLFIEDAFRGPGKLEFRITSAPKGLVFGTFDDPAFQRRVEELNLAGKLKLLGEELVKAVNELHTQGVGLEFFSKELEGAFSANKYIKELPYFLDMNRSGSFYIWVRDDRGVINPVRVELNLQEDATLYDLTYQINSALSQAGYNTGQNYDIRAIIRNGKLVFQAREGISFAFSNDTSGILLSTGINLFFHGRDPEALSLNPLLVQRPEFISSGKMDVNALVSKNPLFGIFRSKSQVNTNQTFQVSNLYVRLYDERGKAFSYPPLAIYEGTINENLLTAPITIQFKIQFKDANGNNVGSPLVIPDGISSSYLPTWSDLPNLLDGSKGIKATLEGNILRFELVSSKAPPGAVWFEVDEGASGLSPLIKWDESVKAYRVSVNTADTLKDILSKLNRLPFFRAYVDEFGHMVLRLEPNQTKVYGFELGEQLTSSADPQNSTHSILSYLNSKEIQMYIPSFRWDTKEHRYMSGLEHIVKPTVYIGERNVTPKSNTRYRVRFFNNLGQEIGSADVPQAGTIVDLEDLINKFNSVQGIKTQILGDKFYIWLDPNEQGAPSGASYFTIEISDDGNSYYEGSLSVLRTDDGIVGLQFGELSFYLFDEKGLPIDALEESNVSVIDPFRVEIKGDKSLFQILETINDPINAKYALSARLDREGRLIVETTGLYETRSFILKDTKSAIQMTNNLLREALKYNPRNNTYFYLSDYAIPNPANLSFSNQTITLRLWDEKGNNLQSLSNTFTNPNLQNILNWLNNLDLDNDSTADLEAFWDSNSGKLYIGIKDKYHNSNKILYFTLESDEKDFISFLLSKLSSQEEKGKGIIHALSPYTLKRGDNRIAQAIADSATQTRSALNLSTIENYYSSVVGEVGTATKAVKESRAFLDDLLRQLSAIKDSISGVSLDEEMANLIKYQQAFMATAKILTTVEDMFEALISAKR